MIYISFTIGFILAWQLNNPKLLVKATTLYLKRMKVNSKKIESLMVERNKLKKQLGIDINA
jgi:hypothetical protein